MTIKLISNTSREHTKSSTTYRSNDIRGSSSLVDVTRCPAVPTLAFPQFKAPKIAPKCTAISSFALPPSRSENPPKMGLP